MNKTSTSKPHLSIIVISYQTRQMTLDCIQSIYDQTETPFELIVLDNASTDGSAEAVADRFPNASLIAESSNHGFGPAHHIAMRHVSTDWILLLNPDTVVLDHAIDRLFAFARSRPDAGIWGGRTLNADLSLNPASCFGRMTLWSTISRVLGLNAIFRRSEFFNSEYFGDWPRDTVREVDIVSGCFLLIGKETWDALGGFDDAFKMYGEETDMCLRSRALGCRPVVTPDAEIIHYGGASQAVRSEKMVRLLRAKVELINRHFPKWQRALGRAVFRLWPLSRLIATSVAGKVLRKPHLAETSRTWAEVWRKRSEWQNGIA
ncbi:MAG: glycosyltransferase family 2 protein [Alphaproteobacteria bacterium]|nr:glycosyltransferase family 2 protein [Alphaproteobacteria bacterium]NNF24950.1 glycosyltransferase family 2 protein [Paracoccaceae bacterium]